MHHTTDRPNTIAAYEGCWRRLEAWAAEQGIDPWQDLTDRRFVTFIDTMDRAGLAATTISQVRAAVRYRFRTDPDLHDDGCEMRDDRDLGCSRLPGCRPCPASTTRTQAKMKAVLDRDRKRPVAQAKPLTRDLLVDVLVASRFRRSGEAHADVRPRHIEMEATLWLMFSGALRVDDMARIEWRHLDPTIDDNGRRGLHVPEGKTDRARETVIEPEAWDALERWQAISPATAPKDRITTASGAVSLHQRIYRLGVVAGEPISGHSLRRGRATQLAEDGATTAEIMAICGWESPHIAHRYIDLYSAKKAAASVDRRNGHKPKPATTSTGMPVDVDLLLSDALAALSFQAELDALPPEHRPSMIEDLRRFIIEQWPLAEKPADCSRPGCPGIIQVASRRPGEKFCSPACRANVRNAAKRAKRRAEATA